MDIVINDGLPDITDKEFDLFRKLIYDRAGISMNESKKSLVRGRLLRRIRHHNLKNYKEYYNLVTDPATSTDEEVHILIDLLTTHETYFFREPDHFTFLEELLTKEKDNLSELKIWIAASSSGEEAYTAAMIVDDVLGTKIPWDIVASDVSRGIVEVAESGVYSLERASKIPDKYLKKYCSRGVRSMEGLFRINSDLKNRINFRQINLLDELPFSGKFDIIFLRNVMIYFNVETKKEVISKMIDKLKPGGHLIVGHSESLNGMNTGLNWIRQSVYQKA